MKILNSDELNLKMESMGGEKVKQAIELFTKMKDSKEFNKINNLDSKDIDIEMV